MLLKAKSGESSLKLFFVILLIADVVYTYLQNHYGLFLDGDMSALIMPSDPYKKVLTDPFGFSVLFHKEQYAATNRFFIHGIMQGYFKSVPFFFQHFFNPIDSVFISVAFAQTFFQVALIILISFYASGSTSLWNKNFLIAALIITPFFQRTGYYEQMALTDNSITYSFFYSLPLILMLLYFQPFFFNYILNKKTNFNFFRHLFLIVLLLMICFGGSLGSPVVLIICGLSLLYSVKINYKKTESESFVKSIWISVNSIDKKLLFHFSFAIFIALYSIYVGTFNVENLWYDVSLKERYLLLPKGLWRITTYKLGIGFLMVLAFFYTIVLSLKKSEDYKRRITFIKWLSVFCLFFILLLPLGGYRAYRPLIIRNDTFNPVTLAVFIAYGLTAIMLLKQFSGKKKTFLIFGYLVIAGIYMKHDKFPDWYNTCQRDALKIISESQKPVAELDGCYLMSWSLITNHEDSDLNARLIQYWGITKEKVHYINKN